MSGEKEVLDGGMAEGDSCPRRYEGEETPGEEVGGYEEETGCDEEEEKDG